MSIVSLNYEQNYFINKFDFIKTIYDSQVKAWNHLWSFFGTSKKDMSVLLPSEIWLKIIEELNPYQILQFSTVSYRMHTLALDTFLWHNVSIKHKMHIHSGLRIIDEWKLFLTIQNEGNYSDLMSRMALAIGPTFMKMVVTGAKDSALFYRSKKEAYHFKCKEIKSDKSLTVSILETDNSDSIIISYKGLLPILEEKGIFFKIAPTGSHITLSKTQNIFDYFTRLVSGQTCGLLCQNEEDQRFTIQLTA